jgi:hypothetical protein
MAGMSLLCLDTEEGGSLVPIDVVDKGSPVIIIQVAEI